LNPNYDSYSYEELLDAREYIDHEAFPERFVLLNNLISKRKNEPELPITTAEIPFDLNKKRKEIVADIRSTKLFLIIGVLALVYGYYSNTFHLPIWKRHSLESTGVSFWFTVSAIVCLTIHSGITILMYRKPSFISLRLINLNSAIKYIGFGVLIIAYLTATR
jgi:hypothetical protein